MRRLSFQPQVALAGQEEEGDPADRAGQEDLAVMVRPIVGAPQPALMVLVDLLEIPAATVLPELEE